MDKEFWLNKWKNGETGFHQPNAHWAVQKYWKAPTALNVLVPLCGKSRDILWLLQRGHTVIGVELSEMAILEFFVESKLRYSIDEEEKDGQKVFKASDVPLILIKGDFFNVKLPQPCHALYDRASLVALPKEMRKKYYDKLQQLLVETPYSLLTTVSFDDTKAGSPPFSIPIEEFQHKSFYGPKVEEKELIEEEDKFREKGITSFMERVFLQEKEKL